MQEENHRPGFTLLEVVLAIIIFSALISISILVAFNAIARTNLRSTENALVQMIRRAQTQSQQNRDGKQWGIQVDETLEEITLFYGDALTDFAGRDGEDATYAVNANMTFAGTLVSKNYIGNGDPGITFEQFTGDINTAGFDPEDRETLIMSLYGSSRSVTINGRGVIER